MASTKLTKDMRTKFVGAALKSTFKPRFDALKEKQEPAEATTQGFALV